MLRNMLGLGMLLDTQSFQNGQKAGREGLANSENPYGKGSSHWSDWHLGWRIATRSVAIEEARACALEDPAASAYEMGHAAAARGQRATDNPYHYGHPAHEDWRLGWVRQRRRA